MQSAGTYQTKRLLFTREAQIELLSSWLWTDPASDTVHIWRIKHKTEDLSLPFK